VSLNSTTSIFTPRNSFTDGIEGPACDAHGNLYAVNFAKQGTIGVITPDGVGYVFVELPEGSVGNGIRFDSHGNMLVADYKGHKIYKINMRSRKIEVLAHEERMHQPNDLCITEGDVVFASDPDWDKEKGQVWRVDADGKCSLAAGDMGTTNGIEVAPDEGTLYVNESVQRRIWAFDLKDGALSNKRLLIEFPDHGLDGMRCDVEGRLYVTRYGKGTIAVLSPKGEVLREIPLHGAKPSNLCFGGEDGCTVYVTLADQGNVESFRVDVPGREWVLNQRLQKGGWD
jgi:sugar lactone lactonase YvrE